MAAARTWLPVGYGILYRLTCFFYEAVIGFADRHSVQVLPETTRFFGQSKASGRVRAGRVEAGRKEAVARVFEVHGNSILRLAYSYLHNMEDAEDILQDTLIRYMGKAPEFENENHEKAWLLHVAANLSKNKTGYNNIRKTDELREELIAEEEKDLAFVWEAVKGLSESQRAVIHLFYQEGYSTVQIAETLDEKESTVRSHLKRGRDKLREILKEEYDFDEI